MQMDVKVVVENSNWKDMLKANRIMFTQKIGGMGMGVVVNFFNTKNPKKHHHLDTLTIEQSMHPLDIVWVNWAGELVAMAMADNLAIVMKSV